MIQTQLTLPENYRETYKVDIKNDKKLALKLNLASIPIFFIMFIIGILVVPVSVILDDFLSPDYTFFIKMLVLIAGICIYMVLHELVHGIFMKTYSHQKVHYKVRLPLYACAGNEAYYNKKHYIIIALAPVVIWGIVLAVVSFIVPQGWFWIVWFIEISNIGGATGDFYVTAKFSKMHSDILIQDVGDIMRVYAQEK